MRMKNRTHSHTVTLEGVAVTLAAVLGAGRR